MSIERKKHFIEALKSQLAGAVAVARQAEVAAAELTDTVRSEARSRDDAKSAIDSGRMAAAHRQRRERARNEIETLIAFAANGLKRFPPGSKVALGAMVDVQIEDLDAGSTEERTLFILPVGAGAELAGPGGDGYISVITPASPVGRALTGGSVGDSFETSIAGDEREWTIVDVS